MQFTFDPKTADLDEAATVFGAILPALVKGCRDQGENLAEVQAGVAELINTAWAAFEAAEKEA